MIIDIVKVFLPAVGAFVLGIFFTPFLTSFLYSHKMWKKKAGKIALDGNEAVIFNELHKEREINTPRMGGIIIWLSSATIIVGIWLISQFLPNETTTKLDFLSRSQTWIPLATLLLGAIIGLIDDVLEIKGSINGNGGGLSFLVRVAAVSLIALLVAFWFYDKLDIKSIGLPFATTFGNELYLGPIFVILFLSLYYYK